MTLTEKLIDSSRRHSSRTALWVRGETLTYDELFRRANELARAMVEEGEIRPGDRVAILSHRTSTAYISILATILAGGAYVPLNPRFPVERNASILQQSGARVLVVDNRSAKIVDALRQIASACEWVLAPEENAPDVAQRLAVRLGDGSSFPTVSISDDTLAYVFFTSGSTGVPKGVPITRANVNAYVDGIMRVVGVTESDRIIQLIDFTFDLSVHDMFVTWLAGAALYSVPENASLMASRFVQEHQITGWLSVPSTAAQINQNGLLDERSLPSLRFTLFCGEALTRAVALGWARAAFASRIFNIYGPTEATVAFSAFEFRPEQPAAWAIVPLGLPLLSQRMGIFDGAGKIVENGGVGEIWLSGSQVANGYWNAPDLTKERFVSNESGRWYRTGDLGSYDCESGFMYLGRADHQVKIRGYRVELQEIETVVREASHRDLVAVLPWPISEHSGAQGCVAFVAGDSVDPSAIFERCRARLADYMVPSEIRFLPTLPTNVSGKVDYPALRERLRSDG